MPQFVLFASLAWLIWAGAAGAADAGPAGAATEPVDYVRQVRPILQKHCYSCHSESKQKSGLRLDVKALAFKGGELYGVSIVPNKPSESPLVRFVADPKADLVMPPDGPRLAADEVAVLSRWVQEGARWPDGVDLAKVKDYRDHWAFRPRQRPPVPTLAGDAWSRGPLDRFILARLRQAELTPAPEADRGAWFRRVSFDLVGLPPTPEELDAFLADQRPDAFERVVDQLLDSPRYGERLAQHWLDVVRYADTHGFEVNTERPNAWPYRDYVIAAHNDDTPYDQFVREQLIGDQMGQPAATGFLITASVLLPGQIGKDEPSIRLARQDALDEIVVNVGQTFMGMTIGCARCHDHKFDPIAQRDYYAMQALVAGVEYEDRLIEDADGEEAAARLQQLMWALERRLANFAPLADSGVTRPAVNARTNIDRFPSVVTQKVRLVIESTNRLEPCIDELEVFDADGINLALDRLGGKVTASGSRESRDRHELRFANDGLYGNSRSWMSDETGKGWLQVELPAPAAIERVAWGRDREGKFDDRLPLHYRVEVADAAGNWQTVASHRDRVGADAEADAGSPPATKKATPQKKAGKKKPPEPIDVAELPPKQAKSAQELLKQRQTLLQQWADIGSGRRPIFAGKFRTPDEIKLLRRGDPEQPGDPVPPAVPAVLDTLALTMDAPEPLRRQTLADWLVQPNNLLTARVMANRIWQGHFGQGLVDTPNDFGQNGSTPTHPELLDWLAEELIAGQWSMKRLHRQIVLSATYRQSSQSRPDGLAKDADARLLWRYPLRRLDGETIRDTLLAVSGELQAIMGGSGYNLFEQRGGLSGFTPIEDFEAEGLRRMIYAHKVRRERDAVFGAFDCPDAGQSTPRRRESTTPIQALNLLNSRFTSDRADALAARVEREAGADPATQVTRLYQLVLGRAATAAEHAEVAPLVAEFGLATLGRVLFNSNEFLFLP